MKKEAENQLIEDMFNEDLALWVRDDGAMLLSESDTPEALEALVKAGADSNIDEMINASAGESLGEIWQRNGNFDKALYDKLTPGAKKEAKAFLKDILIDED